MIRLTDQQQNIVYAEENEIYVKAKAGTGKTTTLTEFVRLRKSETFLYIVYNAALKADAKSRFPANTEVHNIHSLAYQHIGHEYQEKLANSITSTDIFEALPCFKDEDIENEDIASLLLDITRLLKGFFNSSAVSIEETGFNKGPWTELAIEYWELMKNVKNSSAPMTHEGYLKLFHLSDPILNFDYILVDEAQDSNEVMADIVYSQKSKKVFVGDDDQKIYGFRGAISVFKDNDRMSPEAGHYYLSESFRFGKNIAKVSNAILSSYSPNRDEKDFVIGTDKDDEVTSVDTEFSYTIITRTNGHLFDLSNEFVREGKKIHIMGSKKNMFTDIKDVYFLYKGMKSKIRNDFIKSFKNFTSLKNMVKYAKMAEISFLIKVIEKYQESIVFVLEQLEKSMVAPKFADVVLTTVHKSKGLEFADVKLAEDFASLFDESGKKIPSEQIDTEEINLYYVAATRSMYTLELNSQLKRLCA